MAILLVPVLFAIVGLLTYALAANPKVSTIGLVCLACGLFVALWSVAGEHVRLP